MPLTRAGLDALAWFDLFGWLALDVREVRGAFHDARRIPDAEAILGDMHLEAAFADPLILLDPTGRLGAVADAVTPEYRRRRHVPKILTTSFRRFSATCR